MLSAGVAFRQQFLRGIRYCTALEGHLCNNQGPNLELTVDRPDRPLRFGATSRPIKKKAAADATAFHDPDNWPARAGRSSCAYLVSS
jgi:hypothetical protein